MRGRETQGLPARVSSVTFGVSMATASREPVGRATGPPGHLGYGWPYACGRDEPDSREDERMWRPRDSRRLLMMHGTSSS